MTWTDTHRVDVDPDSLSPEDLAPSYLLLTGLVAGEYAPRVVGKCRIPAVWIQQRDGAVPAGHLIPAARCTIAIHEGELGPDPLHDQAALAACLKRTHRAAPITAEESWGVLVYTDPEGCEYMA